jgi:porin
MHEPQRFVAGAALVLFALLLTARAGAEEATASQPYTGDFFRRSTLTGDWGGARNDLAVKGIVFDASVTQIGQGVLSGGKDGTWQYGGRGDLTGHLDTQKLGLWPGGFLTVELEGNWDDSVNGSTGALATANTNQIFPVAIGSSVALPALNFTQFLAPYFGMTFGKFAVITSTSGDMNEFAHGKGDTQFLNLAFNVNPTLLVTMPYSPLGAGMIVLPTKNPNEAIVSFMVAQATAEATTSGFGNLSSDDLTFAGEGRVRTGFFGLTGHQLVGGAYSNKTFTSIDQRVSFPLQGQKLAPKDGSWVVYCNFDQYFYEAEKGSGRGVGLFGRFGASDGNPNFMEYFYSAGVGGKGFFSSRADDQFGLGYYYVDVQSPTLQGPLRTRSFLRDEWGFEAFYNAALTPWLLLTPDIQIIGPTQKQRALGLVQRESVDTAVVLGFRIQLIL